ncbi:hypothetical protein DPMN_100521 [Dreissena polymorpha]|uniref:Uncharacterized protein n=1 Tax=Dreissena polymorpha TaxID=45954 RepID=A0A9D4LHK5_DREPO|nr:hypothetical protein DPMN_100521 [Dreissena polymorpha]
MLTSSVTPGVTAAIIPMPWKVPYPSKVHILWSTLSATNCKEDDYVTPGMCTPFVAEALVSNLITSL